MENKNLTTVALRYRAIYLDIRREDIDMSSVATVPAMAFVSKLKANGFCVSEELLHALSVTSTDRLVQITNCIDTVMRVKLNWAPLVKGWDVPTGEDYTDHLITLFVNLSTKKSKIKGTELPCGHLIPDGTFPIERYNGCPFCGTQFETADFVHTGQASKLKELRLFTRSDMQRVLLSLLQSPTPLDGTQSDSLKLLLQTMPLPDNANIVMKETAMLVAKTLVEADQADQAGTLLKTPTDVLRYLWYEKTGYAQIIEPRTLIAHARRLYYHMWGPLGKGAEAAKAMKEKLKLKYDRKACLRAAKWLNNMQIPARQAAEMMNPKRGMWVRVIRALRLGEYSRKQGFEHLAEILDVFYNHRYTTFQGQVDKARSENNAKQMLELLKQRPGLFARSLFATMLRFHYPMVLEDFNEVADQMPARLLLSLGNAAEGYFDKQRTRVARPITGSTTTIEHNPLLELYDDATLQAMAKAVNDLYISSMERRFAAQPTQAKTIYIDPTLFQIPIAVGDRSSTIQDTSCALMGTRFAVQGDNVRLFMQWGAGLHAQHLDMDLSCRIAYTNGHTENCAYFNLVCCGAKHSGDIRSIPEMVGTAEYINLSLTKLSQNGAKFVTFTCNAYSGGSLSPNLVVGWMDSQYNMRISEKKGVAYDPSCVQHMVRISEGNLAKGLVFGVLDVEKREIIWLEMPFTAQTIGGADSHAIEALLKRLEEKTSIGQLLQLKAKAQNLATVQNPDLADEQYTYQWALNPAEVCRLLNI